MEIVPSFPVHEVTSVEETVVVNALGSAMVIVEELVVHAFSSTISIV